MWSVSAISSSLNFLLFILILVAWEQHLHVTSTAHLNAGHPWTVQTSANEDVITAVMEWEPRWWEWGRGSVQCDQSWIFYYYSIFESFTCFGTSTSFSFQIVWRTRMILLKPRWYCMKIGIVPTEGPHSNFMMISCICTTTCREPVCVQRQSPSRDAILQMAKTLNTADELASHDIPWTDEASLCSVHLRHGMIVRDNVVVPRLLPEDVPLTVRQRSTEEFQHTGRGGLLGCGILCCNSGQWQHVRMYWRGYQARHCLEYLLWLLSGPWIGHSVACATWQWGVSCKLNITGHMLLNIFDLPFVSLCIACSDLQFVKPCIIVTLYGQFESSISDENLCRVCGWARIVQHLPLQLFARYSDM
jgi:hypothetical protein